MEIGRKVYYSENGEIVIDKGEMKGNVRKTSIEEDEITFERLLANLNMIEFPYGYKFNEISNMGSYKIVDNDLVIFPKFEYLVTKNPIINDGIDIATIEITAVHENEILVICAGQEYHLQPDAVGKAYFDFASEVVGEHAITIQTLKQGTQEVIIYAELE